MVVDQLGWPERWEARKLPVSRLVEAGDPLWTWRHCPKFGAKLLRQISAEFGPIRGKGPANRMDVGFPHPVDPVGSSQTLRDPLNPTILIFEKGASFFPPC